MQTSQPKTDETFANASGETEREPIHELLSRMSFEDRWKPVADEMRWVMHGCQNPTEHKKILPDYCYPILDVWRRTLFKNFPGMEDIIYVSKKAGAVNGKNAKQIVRMDWRCMGRVVSIGERGVQFYDLELIPMLKSDGLLDLNADDEKKVMAMVFGNRWLKPKLAKLLIHPHRFVKNFVEKCRSIYFKIKILEFSKWGRLAYQAGPKAVAEFKAGLAEGQMGFLNNDSQLVGESNGLNNYQFLLLAWPEIKEMLEREPLPTRTDVFNWTRPYTKAGLCSFIDIDQFRDVCERIKLKFAGRTPKKDPMPSA
jgi:hypothetical protein